MLLQTPGKQQSPAATADDLARLFKAHGDGKNAFGAFGCAAAALRAGVPAVTVPVTADQPFWAGRLAALGAAPEPIPFRTLTAELLADALRTAVGRPEFARAAAKASEHMAGEDGAGRVLRAVGRVAGA